jgi:hypothetical protein
VGEPPLFIFFLSISESAFYKVAKIETHFANLKFCVINPHQSGVDQNKRQETGMKKSPRWRIAIALSALSIIFVSAALAG